MLAKPHIALHNNVGASPRPGAKERLMRPTSSASGNAVAGTTPTLGDALRRGATNRCPVCGEGKVFSGFLRVTSVCETCGAPLGSLRADDAPPYFTILLTGHLLVPGVLWVEKMWMPPMWLHMVIWLPLFAVIATLLLRPIKGAVVGWMVTLGFLPDAGTPAASGTPMVARGAAAAPPPRPEHDA
jgi:uncharacterized protein (DUF983 family)